MTSGLSFMWKHCHIILRYEKQYFWRFVAGDKKKSRNISECKEEHLREPFSYKNHATFYTVKKKEGSCFNGLRTVEQFSNNYNCELSLWWWAWRWLCLENRCNRLSRPVKWLDDVIVLCCCSFLTVLNSLIFKFSMKVKWVFLHQASWECSSFVQKAAFLPLFFQSGCHRKTLWLFAFVPSLIQK